MNNRLKKILVIICIALMVVGVVIPMSELRAVDPPTTEDQILHEGDLVRAPDGVNIRKFIEPATCGRENEFIVNLEVNTRDRIENMVYHHPIATVLILDATQTMSIRDEVRGDNYLRVSGRGADWYAIDINRSFYHNGVTSQLQAGDVIRVEGRTVVNSTPAIDGGAAPFPHWLSQGIVSANNTFVFEHVLTSADLANPGLELMRIRTRGLENFDLRNVTITRGGTPIVNLRDHFVNADSGVPFSFAGIPHLQVNGAPTVTVVNRYRQNPITRAESMRIAAIDFINNFHESGYRIGADRWLGITVYGLNAWIMLDWTNVSTPAGRDAAIRQVNRIQCIDTYERFGMGQAFNPWQQGQAVHNIGATTNIYLERGTNMQASVLLARNLFGSNNSRLNVHMPNSAIEQRNIILFTDGLANLYGGHDLGNWSLDPIRPNTRAPGPDPIQAAVNRVLWIADNIRSNQIATLHSLAIIPRHYTINNPGGIDPLRFLRDFAGSQDRAHHVFTGMDQTALLRAMFENIQRAISSEIVKPWYVIDPMGPGILFREFYQVPASVNQSEHLIRNGNEFRWNLQGWPFVTPRPEGATGYQYLLRYRITLDTLCPNFQQLTAMDTNLRTVLTYTIVVNNQPDAEQTLEFDIPIILGHTGEFQFVKRNPAHEHLLEELRNAPIEDVTFSLFRSEADANASINPFRTITTANDGVVRFADIGSGHVFYMREICAPEGYVISNDLYRVVISFGETRVYRQGINAPIFRRTADRLETEGGTTHIIPGQVLIGNLFSIINEFVPATIELDKNWFDDQGNELASEADIQLLNEYLLRFGGLWTVQNTDESSPFHTTAPFLTNGSIQIAGNSNVRIYEEEMDIFEFVSVYRDGVRTYINDIDFMATPGGSYTIVFNNQMDAVGSLTIEKIITYADYNRFHGNPIFTFRVDGDEYPLYIPLRFTRSIIEEQVGNGRNPDTNIRLSATLDGLPSGVYTIRELESLGFKLVGITICDTRTDVVNQAHLENLGDRARITLGHNFNPSFTLDGNRVVLHIENSYATVTFRNTKDHTGIPTYADMVTNSFRFNGGSTVDTSSDYRMRHGQSTTIRTPQIGGMIP